MNKIDVIGRAVSVMFRVTSLTSVVRFNPCPLANALQFFRTVTFRRFEILALLALVLALIGQHPAGVFAEDRSSTILLRHASSNATHIDNSTTKHSALLEIITAQRKVGDVHGAIQTAAEEPLAGDRDWAWGTVVAIQAQKGDITGATQTLSRISTKLAKANAIVPIAVAYAAMGDIAKALQLAAEIPNDFFAYGDAFLRIATIQAAAGDMQGAMRTVIDTWHYNPYVLSPILEPKLAAGDIDGAVKIANLSQDIYLRSYLLLAVTNHIKDGQRRLDIAATIPTGHAKALAYQRIAEVQRIAGDVPGCLSSLQHAVEAVASIHNIWAKANIQWQIAKTFAEARDVKNARTVAMAIEQDSHRKFALQDIIAIQARGMDYTGALDTASLGREEDFLTDYAFSRVAE